MTHASDRAREEVRWTKPQGLVDSSYSHTCAVRGPRGGGEGTKVGGQSSVFT